MARSELSLHAQTILGTLQRSKAPMSAYDLLDTLRGVGIKAPPTVYRALDALLERGLVHRIETLNAFVACHNHNGDEHAQFAVCRTCGTVTEVHDKELTKAVEKLAARLHFTMEREMLELQGICADCAEK